MLFLYFDGFGEFRRSPFYADGFFPSHPTCLRFLYLYLYLGGGGLDACKPVQTANARLRRTHLRALCLAVRPSRACNAWPHAELSGGEGEEGNDGAAKLDDYEEPEGIVLVDAPAKPAK